jgi:iron complex outermembrane recepter protein
MKNTFARAGIGMAIATLLNPLAQASDHTLTTVVVSASRAETSLAETPVSIGSVSRQTWEADKPKSIGEVINRVPGVFWNDLGNEQHSMGIRQPISTNAMYQYLEDGIPIRPLGVFNHNALSETNLSGAEGVEVVKGAASSLYGSNAVGGAVNMLTRAPSRTPTGHLGIRVDDTDGFVRVDSGASNTWGSLGLRFSHYSSRRESENWQSYSGGQKDSMTLRGQYDLGSSSYLRASLVHTYLDADMPGGVSEEEYRTDPGKSINTFTWRRNRTTRATVAWEGETTANGISTVTLFARNNDHGQLPSYTITSCTTGANCPTGVRGTVNNNHVESLGVDVKHEQSFDWLRARLVSGIYIDRSRNDYVSDNLAITRVRGVNVSYVENNAVNPTGQRDYRADIANDALFAQLEFSPAADWRVVAGARHDRITYDYRNRLKPGAQFGAADEKRSFSRLSPKVGATWSLGRHASLYSNWSQGFTPPEVSQLYSRSAVPDLKPGVFTNIELGGRAQLANGLSLDAALFQLKGRDTIVSYSIAPGNSENRNAGRTRSRGLEVALQQTLGAWDWRLGATFATHRYLSYQASPTVDYSGKEMRAAPRQIINAQVGWKVLPTSRVALALVHQGKYWTDDANTARYPGHTLLNLTASHELGDGWELWGQIRNLTDRLYADSATRSSNGGTTYTVGAPRSLMVGLNKSFGAR